MVADRDDVAEDLGAVMPSIQGRPFCCDCGCNVFHNLVIQNGRRILVCNRCEAEYTPDDGKQTQTGFIQEAPVTPSTHDTLLFQEALAGRRGPDQQRIAEEGLNFIQTLLKKNADYGSSV